MVKEKPNSTRIYDEDGYRQRAACICVKNEAETEVSVFSLLIHACKNVGPILSPICFLIVMASPTCAEAT